MGFSDMRHLVGIFDWMFRRKIVPEYTTPEIVSIGANGVQIVDVTQHRITYVDLKGEEQFVDLEECARNWMQKRDDTEAEFLRLSDDSDRDVASWNSCCVGQRGATDDPPWVEFMNERRTRFEFESYQSIYKELLGPLANAGWHTFDTT